MAEDQAVAFWQVVIEFWGQGYRVPSRAGYLVRAPSADEAGRLFFQAHPEFAWTKATVTEADPPMIQHAPDEGPAVSPLWITPPS